MKKLILTSVLFACVAWSNLFAQNYDHPFVGGFDFEDDVTVIDVLKTSHGIFYVGFVDDPGTSSGTKAIVYKTDEDGNVEMAKPLHSIGFQPYVMMAAVPII